jgi:hypothetical protein
MAQRGRRSGAALAVVNVTGEPDRLQAPAYLNDAERECFVELIDVCSQRHFVASDEPLLVSFVQATLLARRTAHDPEKYATWTQAVRTQAMLATRLGWQPRRGPIRRPGAASAVPWPSAMGVRRMTPADCARRDRILSLMQRYVELGRLVNEDFDREDDAAVAETAIILTELRTVQAEIDALLGQKRH